MVGIALTLSACGAPPDAPVAAAMVRSPALAPVPAAATGTGEVLEAVVDDIVDVVDLVGGDQAATPASGSPAPAVKAPATPAPVASTPAPATAPAVPGSSPPAPPARPVGGIGAYAGLGTWVDVYDWSRTFGGSGALVDAGEVDRMADLGVQTLYIQTSRWNVAEDILEPERLLPIIERARQRGMSVVSWYLPTFVDPVQDLRRLVAAASLDVDAVGVDIESRDIAETAERNRRLVELSRSLRSALPGVAIGAIVFPPVVMEVINTSFWPNFPWEELVPFYDVWVPMAYQSFRTSASGYRDGGRYIAENIDRLRAHVGAGAVVHPVGGIADATTAADVDGMVAAAAQRGAIGGSLYDWRTTAPGLWPHLQAFRR